MLRSAAWEAREEIARSRQVHQVYRAPVYLVDHPGQPPGLGLEQVQGLA